MSAGFTPANWRRLSEVRDEIGQDRLGASLASGTIRAFYIDRHGERHWMTPADWLRPTAAEVMERGQAFVRHAVPRQFGGGTIRHEDAWDLYIEVTPASPLNIVRQTGGAPRKRGPKASVLPRVLSEMGAMSSD